MQQTSVIYSDRLLDSELDLAVNTTPEQFKAMFARKRALVEKERMGFARALHDDVSQSMTVLTIELALLQQRLGANHPDAMKVSEMLELVTSVNKSVRNITNDIRPKILDEFGLVAALRYECKKIQRERAINVIFVSVAEDVPLSLDTATEIFRWVQLVISELIRNAGATSVGVDLICVEKVLELRIKANGDALCYGTLQSEDPLSLLSLEEHAAWIGATIQFDATEKEGTSVALKLSLNAAP